MKPLPYHKPDSVAEAIALSKATPEAMFIAGGTDLMVQLKAERHQPTALISLRNLPELQLLKVGRGTEETVLGASIPIRELLKSTVLCDRYPLLMSAMKEVGSVQIRSAATIGGNIANASPAADTTPALLALGASVIVDTVRVPLTDLLTGPGKTTLSHSDIISSITLPPPEQNRVGLFLKKKRVAMDIAIVNLATSLVYTNGVMSGVRIAAGSVAPTTMRLTKTESLLEGKSLTDELIAEAQAISASEVSPISDIRASADYRRTIVGVFVARSLKSIRNGGAA